MCDFWWGKTEKAKKVAIRSAVRVSDLLVDAVNGGVQESFVNEKLIELETRALAVTVMRFAKQTDQWLAASHTINTAVKVHNFVIQSLSVLATLEVYLIFTGLECIFCISWRFTLLVLVWNWSCRLEHLQSLFIF